MATLTLGTGVHLGNAGLDAERDSRKDYKRPQLWSARVSPMQYEQFARYWIRSRSLRFAFDALLQSHARVGALKWNGHVIYYRAGTSDTYVIYNILLSEKPEYRVPDFVNPATILDIGANIGAASVYFANRFPQATIIACEPVPSNFELLKRNTKKFHNVSCYPIALGSETGHLTMYHSDDPKNLGGFSFYEAGIDRTRRQLVDVKNSRVFLEELGVAKVDLIKIDTEGAEYDILTSIGEDFLRNATWITGELHGHLDFELLAYLNSNFDVSVHKLMKKRMSKFEACRRLEDHPRLDPVVARRVGSRP